MSSMDERLLSLEEIETLSGISRNTLRKECNTGKLPGIRVKIGMREVWKLPAHTVDTLLSKKHGDYDALVSEWKKVQENGFLTGKRLAVRTIETNRQGLLRFWKFLKAKENALAVNAENLRLALSNIPTEENNCHFTQRDQMKKGVVSFCKFLVLKGLKTQYDLDSLRRVPVKRKHPARRTGLKKNQLEALITYNQHNLEGGRTNWDVQLTKTILYLMAYAGLRLSEVLNLQAKDYDRENRVLSVLGKGQKLRKIGVEPKLAEQLDVWVKLHTENRLIPLNKDGIGQKIRRLARSYSKAEQKAGRLGIDITPHGLRRTFITLNLQEGAPPSFIRRAAGHSSLSMQELYDMTDDMEAVEYFRNKGKVEEEKESILEEAIKKKRKNL